MTINVAIDLFIVQFMIKHSSYDVIALFVMKYKKWIAMLYSGDSIYGSSYSFKIIKNHVDPDNKTLLYILWLYYIYSKIQYNTIQYNTE